MLLLITVKNNVVHSIIGADNFEFLEESFKRECSKYGLVPEDADFENGYIELPDGGSICMTSTD